MNNLIVVSTAFSNREDAERVAELLLGRRLIACAHIAGPITSVYRWQGVVNKATEYTLAVKTVRHHWQTLRDILIQEHPYELPEIIAQDITQVSSGYYDWVCKEVE